MKKKKSVLAFVFKSAKPFKFYLGLHLLVVTYIAIDTSLWPYVSKLLVNKVASTPKELVMLEALPLGLLLIVLTILPSMFWRICDYAWMHITPMMKKKITVENTEYLMKHSHNYFQNNFSGALANRIKDLSNCTPKLLDVMLYNFLAVFLSLIVAFFTLYSVHKLFAFGLIIWAVLFIFMAISGAKKTEKMSADIANQASKMVGNIVDTLSNIGNIKFFASSRFEKNKIANLSDEYTKFSKRRNLFLIKFYTIHGLTFSIYFGFCIIALIYLYSQSLVTLGDFLMIFTINNWTIHAMWQAANAMRGFLEDFGTTKQALEIIHQPLEIKDGKEILKIKKGEIIFENVEFSYANSKPIFLEQSVIIKPGQRVGLVGHSGGGKSTFVNLILRFFDVSKGRILIDGQDISRATQDSLREAIGMIPQDPTLFHRTLSENIAYGKINAKQSEIVEAAKKAHADIFIKKLTLGYNSLVGERGIKLSGGQRQRVAIARAFLKNAPILILDEATSQLDSITENLISDSLEKLMKEKTVLVVAHRLSTLQTMDRILVFEKGKIVEDGSHLELLAKNGTYKKLWDAQIGGFLTS